MVLHIKNGRILDPYSGRDRIEDIWVEEGKICEPRPQAPQIQEIEAEGLWVMPGLIDLHVHLRDPGFTYKETISTGTRAAARGGFTTICPMPNTDPAADSPEIIRYVLEKGEKESPVHLVPVGAITIGQKGETLADIGALREAGALGISEDGKSVMNAGLYREAMRQAREAGVVVMAHCEDKNLAGKGCMNQGAVSKRLRLPGISNGVEDVIVARDILLAKETGARLHICHCSTEYSVYMVKAAKARGIAVSAEVCPHHFAMTDEEIPGDNSMYKMNPPLRSRKDVITLREGLRDGIMDCIATDHAPHSAEEKAQSMAIAPFGIVGLETAVPLTITHLVENGYLTPLQMVEKMSWNPAKVLGIPKGTLAMGAEADITIIDPEQTYVVDAEQFVSKGRNTPFQGHKVKGRVAFTIVSGEVVYDFAKQG